MSYPFPHVDNKKTFVCAICHKRKPWKYARVGPKHTKYAGKNLCGTCLIEFLQEQRNEELKEAREQGESIDEKPSRKWGVR